MQIYLIKPTRYDDDGYPLQWWRSIIPSNSLAVMAGIVEEALGRDCLSGMPGEVHVIDEAHQKVDPGRIARAIRRSGGPALIGLVGVQSNQFPRALDLAREFRAAGLPVCIGGFHVSGSLAMLPAPTPELAEAQALGAALFAGEAEGGRIDEVLRDARSGSLKPLYNHLKATPELAGAPIPLMPPEQVARNINRYGSFDLGRGCPFECSFCTIINVQGRKSRFRTADDLEAIIRANAAIGVNRFFLTDDNFARNRNWESLLDRLIALAGQGQAVRLAIQVDTLAHRIDGFIDKCVAAGADQIFIGLENVNSDNLEAVGKRQNRVEEYREMFLAWKRHPVVVTCGYIVGFPNDTYESVMRDIAILKDELPVDTLYLNYLTPLPGSEDHRRMAAAGEWMDPDLSRYDLNHRVTHHPRMSDEEWERAYRDAHAAFYEWSHMERILRRMAALGSNKKLTTVNRLLAYREAVRLEGVAKLESGYVRIRRRRQRRHGLPREAAWRFYPWHWGQVAHALAGSLVTLIRLRLLLRRVLRDPQRLAYVDSAITQVRTGPQDPLLHETRGTAHSDRRQARQRTHEPIA
ncbi:radical SAM protein [Novosphingobium sp.]|uniref:B12-binding domain-containing radical SAM protein n=1 Tax=Novosphingobium sp. TaxID=1874826 RepID=UPI0025F384AA|nr:radical SAM protein [Novosphingobium sp.]MCC6927309.1 radical SAM protein [Novosphingobium sp.]